MNKDIDDHDSELDEEEELSTLTMDEGEEDEGEAWLISYADMMTLIACFFILMTAFASYDVKSFSRMAKEVKEHFEGANVQAKEDEMTELISKLEAITQNKEVIKIRSVDNGIEIKFNSAYLFNTAKSSLKPDMKELLGVIVDVIMSRGKDYIIEAHGHTDSRPLRSGRFENNWELSAARAISVIGQFEEKNYSKNHLVAIGYGSSRPEVLDKDKSGKYIKENLEQNRRVILLVKESSEQILLGLGKIYQKDK